MKSNFGLAASLRTRVNTNTTQIVELPQNVSAEDHVETTTEAVLRMQELAQNTPPSVIRGQVPAEVPTLPSNSVDTQISTTTTTTVNTNVTTGGSSSINTEVAVNNSIEINNNTPTATYEAINNLRQARRHLDNLQLPRNTTRTVPPQNEYDIMRNQNNAIREEAERAAEHFQEHANEAQEIVGNFRRLGERADALYVELTTWVIAHPYQTAFGLAAGVSVLVVAARNGWVTGIVRFVGRLFTGQGSNRNHSQFLAFNIEQEEAPFFNPDHRIARYLPSPTLANIATTATVLSAYFAYQTLRITRRF